MTVSLAENADEAFITYKVRQETRAFLNSLKEGGVAGARYLGPQIVSPTQATDADNFDAEAPLAASNPLSSRTIVLFSVAAGAFVMVIGLAMYFRRLYNNRKEDMQHDDETSAPPLARIDTTDNGKVDSEEQLSPFSEMLPKAYRLDDGSDMSIILEVPEDASIGQSSGILVSEGWSTDSEDLDVSSVMNVSRMSEVPVLGATRLKVRTK